MEEEVGEGLESKADPICTEILAGDVGTEGTASRSCFGKEANEISHPY
jgi:hypothetical protein